MFDTLRQAVGPGMPNAQSDVLLVQRMLNRQASRTGMEVRETGAFDGATETALMAFQRRIMQMHFANGVVTPGSETFRQLCLTAPQRLMAGVAGGLRLPPRTGEAVLVEEDYQAAAAKLGCEVRIIRAVTSVEAPRGAYDEFGRPTILFERHLFSRFTSGTHDRVAPDISNPVQGGYGLYSAQYSKLQRAYQLDATAALRAASWGAFQILGDNYSRAGHASVNLFVAAMCRSIQQQLEAFVAFVKFSPALARAIDKKDWAGFALLYNGPRYRKQNYDVNLEAAYEKAKP